MGGAGLRRLLEHLDARRRLLRLGAHRLHARRHHEGDSPPRAREMASTCPSMERPAMACSTLAATSACARPCRRRERRSAAGARSVGTVRGLQLRHGDRGCLATCVPVTGPLIRALHAVIAGQPRANRVRPKADTPATDDRRRDHMSTEPERPSEGHHVDPPPARLTRFYTIRTAHPSSVLGASSSWSNSEDASWSW